MQKLPEKNKLQVVEELLDPSFLLLFNSRSPLSKEIFLSKFKTGNKNSDSGCRRGRKIELIFQIPFPMLGCSTSENALCCALKICAISCVYIVL